MPQEQLPPISTQITIEAPPNNNSNDDPPPLPIIPITISDHPSNTNTNSPFNLTTESLVYLFHDNRSKAEGEEKLSRVGGVHGLLKELFVDPDIGIVTTPDLDRGKDGAIDGKGSMITEEERRKWFGSNTLPPAATKSLFQSALLSLGVGLYEDFRQVPEDALPEDKKKIHWIEGFAILVAVAIVVLVSSINDFQKEAHFRKLNAKKEDRQVKGLRNGKTQLISVYDVVVGDVLLLEPGDVIPADGVFITGMGVKCDESAATGETDAIKKGDGHDPFILSGSKVNEGIGKYLVTCVGPHSFHGRTMMALRTEMEDTPLQIKLDILAERIAKLGVSAVIFLFVSLLIKYIVTVLRTNGFGESSPTQESGSEVLTQLLMITVTCIAIIAIAVPEGLPLAVTLALAFATKRMIKDNNLVRVLSACETMGNATTICSDKTGTLTENKMTVVTGVVGKNVMFEGEQEVLELKQRVEGLAKSPAADPTVALVDSTTKQNGPDGGKLMDVIMEGVAINSTAFEGVDESTKQKTLIGSKTETALLQWLTRTGYDFNLLRTSQSVTVEQVYPFSSEKKSMATLVKVLVPGKRPIYRIHVKGASEIVLRSCNRFALLPFSPSPTAVQSAIKMGTNNPPLDRVPATGSRSNPSHPTVCPVDPKDGKPRSDYEELIERFASQSLRTICLAYREFSEEEFLMLLHGPIRDKVLIAKKLEEEANKMKRGVSNEPEILKGELPPPSPVANSSAAMPTSTPTRNESLKSISGMLEIPMVKSNTINTDTQSFVSDWIDSRRESTVPSELTDDEILADPAALSELSRHLICAAVVGIEDPLRAGVPEAVKQCQDAGVFVRMVTGDNVSTARSIATKCGILSRGGLVMEGSYFRNMSTEEMNEKLPRLQVLARSSPTDKQLLVSKLKALGETVAVTGDGTNDGPALKMADIGFSMGIAGTEVAKEASSIILMDDSFASVVKAISWGRCVNDAVKKFLQFQLSANVGAVVVSIVSALADSGESSVLTAIQLLWVNLIIDSLGALALASEKPTPELLKRPPDSKRAPLITFQMWKLILGQGALQIIINLSLLFAGPQLFEFDELAAVGGVINVKKDSSDIIKEQRDILRTVVFNSFVLLQIFNMVNARRLDSRINVFYNLWNNQLFLGLFVGISLAQVLIVEFGGAAFQTVKLSLKLWVICFLIGILALPWAVVIRLLPDDFIRRRFNTTAHHDIESPLTSPTLNTPMQIISNPTSPSQSVIGSPAPLQRTIGMGRQGQPPPLITKISEVSLISPQTASNPAIIAAVAETRPVISLSGEPVLGEESVFKALRGEARRKQRNDTQASIGSISVASMNVDNLSVHPSALAIASASSGRSISRIA
ncbi:hypothetical protein HDU76_000076 [Blyttiomyces sp. JEL0837]|nr:hypothetical protein HDU76_000076 [Blyttiomyces sp. JEL0837]